MMLCDKVKSLLSAFQENDLSREESELISNHLNACTDCRQIFSNTKLLREYMLALPSVKPAENFDLLLRQRIQNSQPARSSGFSSRSLTYSLSGVGFITATYFIISIFFMAPDNEPVYGPDRQAPVMNQQVNTNTPAKSELPETLVAGDTVKSQKAKVDQSRINLVNENK